MIETGLQIANLMADDSMSASNMTHALKVLGNGSMHCGFQIIGRYFASEIKEASFQGLKTGRIQGCIGGIAGTLIVCGVSAYTIHKIQQRKRIYTEGQEILKVMNKCYSIDEAPENIDDNIK